MKAYEQIDYRVEGNLLTITLARPEKLNAFTGHGAIQLTVRRGQA